MVGTVSDKRKQEAKEIRAQYPDKCPVYITRQATEKNLPPIDKTKYLVPEHITVGQLVNIIRRRLQLHAKQCLILLVNSKTMASMSMTVGELYQLEQNEDGFLYIEYMSQNVFG